MVQTPPQTSGCSKFDLTFCEIWFDGYHVYMNDEQGVREKRGELRQEYLKNLVQTNNRYTLKRIRIWIETTK